MCDWCLLFRPLRQGAVPLARGAGARQEASLEPLTTALLFQPATRFQSLQH